MNGAYSQVRGHRGVLVSAGGKGGPATERAARVFSSLASGGALGRARAEKANRLSYERRRVRDQVRAQARALVETKTPQGSVERLSGALHVPIRPVDRP